MNKNREGAEGTEKEVVWTLRIENQRFSMANLKVLIHPSTTLNHFRVKRENSLCQCM